MEKNEARQILQAYRSDLSAIDDPNVREALRLAEDDPQLQALLKEEQAFDRAFAEKLQQIEPPASLMERILENAPLETNSMVEQQKPAKLIWWKNPAVWSAAACLLALIALAAVFMPIRSPSANQADLVLMNNFARAAALHSPTIHQMDFQHNNISEIGAYLAKNNSPHPRDLPGNMDQLLGMGCVTYTWENNPVGVICLQGKKVYNLYVANQDGLAIERDQPSPSYKQFGNYSTALWTKGNLVYVLTVEGKQEDLSPLL